MKEMLRLMTRYNMNANKGMMKVLEKVNIEDLKKDMGLYYDSVLGTFEHNLIVDIAIFGGVFRSYCKNPDAVNAPVFKLASLKDGLKPEVKKDLETLFDVRKEVDEAMTKLVDDLDDLNKIEELEFPGVTFKKPRFQMVMSILVHSSHHRGQIAAALDILGIDNDFAGMLAIK